jgi:hypothetical protein
LKDQEVADIMEVNMSSMTWMKLGVQLVGVASPVLGNISGMSWNQQEHWFHGDDP